MPQPQQAVMNGVMTACVFLPFSGSLDCSSAPPSPTPSRSGSLSHGPLPMPAGDLRNKSIGVQRAQTTNEGKGVNSRYRVTQTTVHRAQTGLKKRSSHTSKTPGMKHQTCRTTALFEQRLDEWNGKCWRRVIKEALPIYTRLFDLHRNSIYATLSESKNNQNNE